MFIASVHPDPYRRIAPARRASGAGLKQDRQGRLRPQPLRRYGKYRGGAVRSSGGLRFYAGRGLPCSEGGRRISSAMRILLPLLLALAAQAALPPRMRESSRAASAPMAPRSASAAAFHPGRAADARVAGPGPGGADRGAGRPPPPGYYGRGYREAPRYAPQPRPQPYYWAAGLPAWGPGANPIPTPEQEAACPQRVMWSICCWGGARLRHRSRSRPCAGGASLDHPGCCRRRLWRRTGATALKQGRWAWPGLLHTEAFIASTRSSWR